MAEICMRYFGQIVSFMVFIIGSMTKFLGKYSHAIDDGISFFAGVVGLIGGFVWLSMLKIKKSNERLEHEIKVEELKRIKNE